MQIYYTGPLIYKLILHTSISMCNRRADHLIDMINIKVNIIFDLFLYDFVPYWQWSTTSDFFFTFTLMKFASLTYRRINYC